MQQIYDIDTVGFSADALGSYYDFYVNNTFYLLAPSYYFTFYSVYLRRCLSCYDGYFSGFHNTRSGLVPQKLLQSITTGLNNLLFSKEVDFSGNKCDYEFAKMWSEKTKFSLALKKAHKFAIAGGTSLLTLNRTKNTVFAKAYRIDTFYPNIDANGNVTAVKIYYDILHNAKPDSENGSQSHYGICEERYYNEKGKPCVKQSIYRVNGNLQTSIVERVDGSYCQVPFIDLPDDVQKQITENYPSVLFDEEQYLPFPSIACYLIKFTDDIPQIPNSQFGQPIGDILFTENFQYDQMKYFEKNEVDLARARALIPENFWNMDDPDYDNRALSERFYQKVSSLDNDSDKITPIQFQLRGNDMKTQKENIYKDIALKLNISASTVATFLNEGSGARTATEILRESTKTDTWVGAQITLIQHEINALMKEVMLYYGYNAVKVIIRAEDESPYLDKLKTNSDVFSAGNMSPERFVADTYKNLSLTEQNKEIAFLKKKVKQQQQTNLYGFTNTPKPTQISMFDNPQND